MTAAARRHGKVFVISSPSGGGKTTVVRALLKRLSTMARSVSVTTRAQRVSERPGVDYRFVTVDEFRQLRDDGRLLEWAKVHRAYYGTLRDPVERAIKAGRDVILCIDVQGAKQVRRVFADRAVLIFLLPPSIDDLRNRLVRRQTETLDSIRHRLQAARRELACATWYDYGVVNQRVDVAVQQLEAIVTAERLRMRE